MADFSKYSKYKYFNNDPSNKPVWIYKILSLKPLTYSKEFLQFFHIRIYIESSSVCLKLGHFYTYCLLESW
jgi:hypothetical protein